jgi:hypothetical protein
VAWLYIMPPVGLWKLWHDPELSATAKWRILIYLFLIPTLAYLAVSLLMANRVMQNFVP